MLPKILCIQYWKCKYRRKKRSNEKKSNREKSYIVRREKVRNHSLQKSPAQPWWHAHDPASSTVPWSEQVVASEYWHLSPMNVPAQVLQSFPSHLSLQTQVPRHGSPCLVPCTHVVQTMASSGDLLWWRMEAAWRGLVRRERQRTESIVLLFVVDIMFY